jgi:hypothetical protein
MGRVFSTLEILSNYQRVSEAVWIPPRHQQPLHHLIRCLGGTF